MRFAALWLVRLWLSSSADLMADARWDHDVDWEEEDFSDEDMGFGLFD